MAAARAIGGVGSGADSVFSKRTHAMIRVSVGGCTVPAAPCSCSAGPLDAKVLQKSLTSACYRRRR